MNPGPNWREVLDLARERIRLARRAGRWPEVRWREKSLELYITLVLGGRVE